MERIFAVGLDYLARCSYFPDITENAVHSSLEISGNSIHYISSNGKCPLCEKNAQEVGEQQSYSDMTVWTPKDEIWRDDSRGASVGLISHFIDVGNH